MILLEEMALNAWPALTTTLHKGCVFRSAGHYSNRSNSANPLYSTPEEYGSLIEYAEKYFSDRDHSSTFKIITHGSYANLDNLLERRGYRRIHDTRVLDIDLCSLSSVNPSVGVEVTNRFSDEWISAVIRMNAISDGDKDTFTALITSISVHVRVACVRVEGKVVACGYGAIEDGWAGFFDIIVDEGCRNKGYATGLLASIAREAREAGATRGYLQVMDNNLPARALYDKLGFVEAYRYWYRKKDQR